MNDLVWCPCRCHIHYELARWEGWELAGDDYRTLREVSVAMNGISKQIGLLKWFGTGVALTIFTAGGAIFYQGFQMSNAIARIDERTIGIQRDLASIQATLSIIRDDIAAPKKASLAVPPSASSPDLIGTSGKADKPAVIETLPHVGGDKIETWKAEPKQ